MHSYAMHPTSLTWKQLTDNVLLSPPECSSTEVWPWRRSSVLVLIWITLWQVSARRNWLDIGSPTFIFTPNVLVIEIVLANFSPNVLFCVFQV